LPISTVKIVALLIVLTALSGPLILLLIHVMPAT
jgi:hypothetical protein